METPDTQRTYHETEAEYNLPNDSAEHARLEDQASGFAELMHGNIIHAPLTNPERLLDIGCGTGVVTHNFSSLFPSATIYGVDLTPVPAIRPDTPTNICYIQGDVKKLAQTDPRLAAGSLDYVFSRLLICGMTDWARYIKDVVALRLKPGGWAEVQDLDYVFWLHGQACSGEWRWLKALRKGALRKDLDLDCGSNAAKYMREAGLVDVRVQEYGIPFGKWATKDRPETERLGAHQVREMPGIFWNMIPRVVEGLGLPEEEVKELQMESRKCLAEEEGKQWRLYITVGRRPLS